MAQGTGVATAGRYSTLSRASSVHGANGLEPFVSARFLDDEKHQNLQAETSPGASAYTVSVRVVDTRRAFIEKFKDRRGVVLARKLEVEMLAAWQEKEATRELLRADPGSSNFRRSLKKAGRRLKRVRIEDVQISFEEFVSQLEGQLEVRIKDGDRAGFFMHLKGMDFEMKESCSS